MLGNFTPFISFITPLRLFCGCVISICFRYWTTLTFLTHALSWNLTLRTSYSFCYMTMNVSFSFNMNNVVFFALFNICCKLTLFYCIYLIKILKLPWYIEQMQVEWYWLLQLGVHKVHIVSNTTFGMIDIDYINSWISAYRRETISHLLNLCALVFQFI